MSGFGDLMAIGGMGAAMAASGGAINPLTAAAIMGGTGLLAAKDAKNEQLDVQKKNAEAAAAMTRFSPYTKMGAGTFKAAPTESVMGGGMKGATAGLQLSQNYNKAQLEQNMMAQNPNNMSMGNNQMAGHINGLGTQMKSPYTMSYGSYGNTAQG